MRPCWVGIEILGRGTHRLHLPLGWRYLPHGTLLTGWRTRCLGKVQPDRQLGTPSIRSPGSTNRALSQPDQRPIAFGSRVARLRARNLANDARRCGKQALLQVREAGPPPGGAQVFEVTGRQMALMENVPKCEQPNSYSKMKIIIQHTRHSVFSWSPERNYFPNRFKCPPHFFEDHKSLAGRPLARATGSRGVTSAGSS